MGGTASTSCCGTIDLFVVIYCNFSFVMNWRETSSSASTVVVDHTNLPGNSHSSNVRTGSSHSRWQDTVSPFARPTSVTSTVLPRPHYFKFQLFPGKFMKIQFDRLVLLALMDRYGVFCGFDIDLFIWVLEISIQSAVCIVFPGGCDPFELLQEPWPLLARLLAWILKLSFQNVLRVCSNQLFTKQPVKNNKNNFLSKLSIHGIPGQLHVSA